jgi:CheY-like chemotaxis protein
MRFIWIDDDNGREEASVNMSKALDVKIYFENVHGKEIDEELSRILDAYNGNPPDLVIMDHVLSQLASGIVRKGSTAATRIKEKWSECPVISVTAAINNHSEEIDTRQEDAYENMFPSDHISDYYQTIKSISDGFKSLKENRPQTPDDLPKVLNCPEIDRARLMKILPNKIKIRKNFNDRSLLIEVYKWLNSIFFKRPGFLYDELWAATYLGLSLEGFKIVTKEFEKAKYNGPFQDPSQPRWWKSSLKEILVEKFEELGLPWVIGRKLVRDKELYSKDHVKEEEFPETVAAEDDSIPPIWYPMKLKYTEPHPSFENLLFFEELRIMKPDK